VRLLLDEMVPPAVAEQLRLRGHDVRTVVDMRLSGAPDHVVWGAAREGDFVLVTEDTDFRDIMAEDLRLGRPHAGIIFTSGRRFPRGDHRTRGRLVSALDELLASGIDLTNREYWLT